MADDTHAQNDPQVDDAPAEPPLTDIENPLVDDDDKSKGGKDDGHGWIPPVP
jgi:hypothetical protein